MVFKQQMRKLVAVIKGRLQRRRRINTTVVAEPPRLNDTTVADSDNSLNEMLEARLREIIAAASPQQQQSLENPMLLHAVVPACPDSVCRHYRLTIQTCFQTAQPQCG
jgi:hypothetical protein